MFKQKFNIVLIMTSIFIAGFSTINIYANSDIKIEPIFTIEQGLWYPGRIESKDFYITNNKDNNISIDRLYIQLKSSKDLNSNQLLDINSRQFKELAKSSTVKLNYKNTVLFEERLDKLLSEKGIVLSKDIYIKSNGKALLNMTIDMDEEMNNDAQALENIFSIGVAYKIDNTNPPIDPGEPDKEIPLIPLEPSKPIDPTNPDKEIPLIPLEPSKPIDPVDPDEEKPLIPLEPSKPIDPTNPDPPVKPGTGVGGETDENGSDKLPQTGGLINSTSLLALGTIAIGTGIVLNKKSSKEKGGKHHE